MQRFVLKQRAFQMVAWHDHQETKGRRGAFAEMKRPTTPLRRRFEVTFPLRLDLLTTQLPAPQLIDQPLRGSTSEPSVPSARCTRAAGASLALVLYHARLGQALRSALVPKELLHSDFVSYRCSSERRPGSSWVVQPLLAAPCTPPLLPHEIAGRVHVTLRPSPSRFRADFLAPCSRRHTPLGLREMTRTLSLVCPVKRQSPALACLLLLSDPRPGTRLVRRRKRRHQWDSTGNYVMVWPASDFSCLGFLRAKYSTLSFLVSSFLFGILNLMFLFFVFSGALLMRFKRLAQLFLGGGPIRRASRGARGEKRDRKGGDAGCGVWDDGDRRGVLTGSEPWTSLGMMILLSQSSSSNDSYTLRSCGKSLNRINSPGRSGNSVRLLPCPAIPPDLEFLRDTETPNFRVSSRANSMEVPSRRKGCRQAFTDARSNAARTAWRTTEVIVRPAKK